MSRTVRLVTLPFALLGMFAAACGTAEVGVQPAPLVDESFVVESTTTTVPPTTLPATTSTSTTSTTTTAAAVASTTTTIPPEPPVYHEQDFTPMTTVGEITLTHPAARVEFIGFHQAGHDGSQGQATVAGAAPSTVLDDRGRNTSPTGAADVVVDPTAEIRSPVTGTVIRAGGYVLYCDNEDHFVVIEPDAHPGWEVKVFHMEGLLVEVGDRVEAGVTPIAPNARRLPFVSQVDAFTAEPSNPHVHIEVVDPSIPDIPSGSGGGC